eukprot:5634219-Prymnesium_polylepis.1
MAGEVSDRKTARLQRAQSTEAESRVGHHPQPVRSLEHRGREPWRAPPQPVRSLEHRGREPCGAPPPTSAVFGSISELAYVDEQADGHADAHVPRRVIVAR